jgi:hypothetical protein
VTITESFIHRIMAAAQGKHNTRSSMLSFGSYYRKQCHQYLSPALLVKFNSHTIAAKKKRNNKLKLTHYSGKKKNYKLNTRMQRNHFKRTIIFCVTLDKHENPRHHHRSSNHNKENNLEVYKHSLASNMAIPTQLTERHDTTQLSTRLGMYICRHYCAIW